MLKCFCPLRILLVVLMAFNLLLVSPLPYNKMVMATNAEGASPAAEAQGSGLSSLNQSANSDDDKTENYGNGSTSEPSSFNASFPQSTYSPDFSVFDNASRHYSNPNAKPISVGDYDKLKNCSAYTSKNPSGPLR